MYVMMNESTTTLAPTQSVPCHAPHPFLVLVCSLRPLQTSYMILSVSPLFLPSFLLLMQLLVLCVLLDSAADTTTIRFVCLYLLFVLACARLLCRLPSFLPSFLLSIYLSFFFDDSSCLLLRA